MSQGASTGAQVGSAEDGSPQFGIAEIGLAEGGTDEAGFFKVWFYIWMLFPPVVPRHHSLFEHIKMLPVCHGVFSSSLSILGHLTSVFDPNWGGVSYMLRFLLCACVTLASFLRRSPAVSLCLRLRLSPRIATLYRLPWWRPRIGGMDSPASAPIR